MNQLITDSGNGHDAMSEIRSISRSVQIDPDISATLSDFSTYTEHLPSAVVRSMTLICAQDKLASHATLQIHDLLAMYSQLPSLRHNNAIPDATTLRRDISHAYERLEKARRVAFVESTRMFDMVKKDQIKLRVINQKLKQLPLPPSRESTPEPRASTNVQIFTSQDGQKSNRTGLATRNKAHRVIIPGEVLPPLDAGQEDEMSDSDAESIDPDARNDGGERKKLGRPRKLKEPKEPKEPREKKERKERKEPKDRKEPKEKKEKIIRIREDGEGRPRGRSAVAGISTTNAILQLIPPPDEAIRGSIWLPWKRITEYELAKLRKRMKKNAAWRPSSTMRKRELQNLGRGSQAMEEAREQASINGTVFVDQGGDDWIDPTKRVAEGLGGVDELNDPISAVETNDDAIAADQELINRGMRLNEAKKRKREREMEEQAIQERLEAEHQASLLVQSDNQAEKRKRKRDSGSDVPNTVKATTKDLATVNPRKRLKLTIPKQQSEGNGHSAIETSALSSINMTAPFPTSIPPSTFASAVVEETDKTRKTPRSSIILPSPRITIRPIIEKPLNPNSSSELKPSDSDGKGSLLKLPRRLSGITSAVLPGPSSTLIRNVRHNKEASRRRAGSVGSRPINETKEDPVTTNDKRIKKHKPIPGLITSAEDGKRREILGTRKNKPKTKSKTKMGNVKGRKNVKGEEEKGQDVGKEEVEEEEEEEGEEDYIDPDEPRYCICGGPSWGTMVECEMTEEVCIFSSYYNIFNTNEVDESSAKNNGFILNASN